MSWNEVKVENQRKLFVEAYLKNKFTMAGLCRQFDISRKNGYKWVKRFLEEGIEGLQNRSKRPFKQPKSTDPGLVKEMLKIKYKYPRWSPFRGNCKSRK